jgi:hypothetical protein
MNNTECRYQITVHYATEKEWVCAVCQIPEGNLFFGTRHGGWCYQPSEDELSMVKRKINNLLATPIFPVKTEVGCQSLPASYDGPFND